MRDVLYVSGFGIVGTDSENRPSLMAVDITCTTLYYRMRMLVVAFEIKSPKHISEQQKNGTNAKI